MYLWETAKPSPSVIVRGGGRAGAARPVLVLLCCAVRARPHPSSQHARSGSGRHWLALAHSEERLGLGVLAS